MRKLGLVCMMFLMFTGVATGSTINGEFDGNPIVKVISDGQELRITDVPAINYKDRTMIPIYLFEQLGAKATWDSNTYSVHVQMNNKPDLRSMENELLIRDLYTMLSDLDHLIVLYLMNLQQYVELDRPEAFSPQFDIEYQKLLDQFNAEQAISSKLDKQISSNTRIKDIIYNHTQLLSQIGSSKNTLKIWVSQKNNNPVQAEKTLTSLKISLQNSLQRAMQTLLDSNQYYREYTFRA